MRRPVVAGNWKMHGSRAANEALLGELGERVKPEWHVEVAVFPPYVYLSEAVRALEEADIDVGAQDVCAHPVGAFTGQVAASMLKDVGCRYVIVGHSERRRLYHEDDTLVARKYAAALNVGLTPVLCVGETLEERESGRTMSVVERQVRAILGALAESDRDAAIAYEPVWAIGTGKTAGPAEAQEVHAAIRALLAQSSAALAARTRILYGGSVKPDNARALLAEGDVDGALVGGASLDKASFGSIVLSAESLAAA